MKKILPALVIGLAALTGCSPTSTDRTPDFRMPEGLKDCKVYKLTSSGLGTALYVTRCSNNDTVATTKPGKHPVHVALVND